MQKKIADEALKAETALSGSENSLPLPRNRKITEKISPSYDIIDRSLKVISQNPSNFIRI